ncbi:MAG: hypothetical protein AAF533_14240 [Acidobacteriota bacterium]
MGLLASCCAAACLALAASSPSNFEAGGWQAGGARTVLRVAGLGGLVVALVGFVWLRGLEVGLAWFLLWLGLTGPGCNLLLGWRPRLVRWLGPLALAVMALLAVAELAGFA